MRAPSVKLLASCRLHEGLALTSYPDPKSHGAPWTIGYGHTKGVRQHQTCTKVQAEAWLEEDAQDAMNLLNDHEPWATHLLPARYDALAEMVFNMGWGKVAEFHAMLNALQQANYKTAAAEALNSGWAHDVGERAQRLAGQIASGCYSL